jgi:hypothetical protein
MSFREEEWIERMRQEVQKIYGENIRRIFEQQMTKAPSDGEKS